MTLDEAIKRAEEKVAENEEIYEAHCRIYSKEVVEKYPSPQCKKCAEEHRQLAEWLKELKQLREQTRWIPVSERLPDDRKDCIVTFKDRYVDIMCYAPDLYRVDEYDFYAKKGKAGWYDYDSEWGFYSRDDVIAWMPLPEPYKVESEE